MTEKILVIDIEPKANNPVADGAQHQTDRLEERLWTRSDNSFKFNFLPNDSSTTITTDMSSTDGNASPVKTTGTAMSTGKGSGFAFNFQIPSVSSEDTESQTAPQATSDDQGCAKDKTDVETQKDSPTTEPPAASKAKKKKKSKKKKDPESSEVQEKTSTERGSGDDIKELTVEEQLNRELDWCIEQLEAGLRTQKGTPKQKEEVSRALRTLRSSKAPLAKKRQVMRSMTGDYRKKMSEEKNKQFKLIENAMTSAQVKSVSSPSKKSVFHRKADSKTQTPNAELKSQRDTGGNAPNTNAQRDEEVSSFVFAPSKDEFRFNFL